jgi:hypothetical protein
VSQVGAIRVCGDPLDYDPADYSYLPNQVTIGGTNLVDKLVEFRVSKAVRPAAGQQRRFVLPGLR